MTYRPHPPLHGQALALQKYEAYLVSRGLAPVYIEKTMIHLRQVSRDLDLDTATTEQLTDWLARRTPISRASILHKLRLYYKWCVEVRQNLRIDPSWAIVRPRRTVTPLPRAIADDDLEKALVNADPRMRVMLLLGCLAGLRCCEIGALHREDMGEAHMTLKVRAGKGGHQRMVPLHPELLEALRAWGMPEKGPLFKGQDLRPMMPRTVSQIIGRYFASLGIKSSAHQLRHHFATQLYRNTLDIRLTGDLLGHRKIETTLRYAQADMTKASGAVGSLRADTREAGFREVS